MIEQIWTTVRKNGEIDTKRSFGVGFHDDGTTRFVPFAGLKLPVSKDVETDGFIIPDALITECPRLCYKIQPRDVFTNEKKTTLLTFYLPKGWNLIMDKVLFEDPGAFVRINHHYHAKPEEFGFCIERSEESTTKWIGFSIFDKRRKLWNKIICPVIDGLIQGAMYEEQYNRACREF